MSSRLPLIIFDLDGTLVDGQHRIIQAMEMAFGSHGYSSPDAGAVRQVIGLELSEAILKLNPALDTSVIDALVQSYKDAFYTIRTSDPTPEPLMPGAMEVLIELEEAGYQLGVATGKGRRGMHAVLGDHGVLDKFVTLKCADDGPGKPDPTILHHAIAEAGSAPGDTLVVGDTVFDIQLARNAKVRSVGVTWGYHESEMLVDAGADLLINSFQELLPSARHLLALDQE